VHQYLDEDEAGNPEVVTDVDTLDGSDLELPLRGHDLGVGAANLDTGVEAGLVVGLDDVATKDLGGTDTAVVGSLGSGETGLGPAEGVAIGVEERVLLLDAEPGLVLLDLLKDLVGLVARVGGVGGAIVVEGLMQYAISKGKERKKERKKESAKKKKKYLGEDEDVVTATEGVGKDGNGLHEHVRVVAGGLASGRAVKVPDLELVDRLGDLVEGHGLLAEVLLGAVNPDVGGEDLALLVEVLELLVDSGVVASGERHCAVLGGWWWWPVSADKKEKCTRFR